MVYDLKPKDPHDAEPIERFGRETPPPDKSIDRDLPCLRCGYNLRGLTLRHRCPECGADIRRSVSGENLLGCSEPWLRSMAWGLGLMLWSVLSYLAVIVGMLLYPILAYFVAWVSAGLAIAGVFCLTRIDPQAQDEERPYSVRRLLRAAAVVRFACVAVVLLSMLRPTPPVSLITGATLLEGAALVAIILGVSYFLRDFARRMEDFELEHGTNSVLWGFAISAGVFVLLGGLTTVLGGRVGPGVCIAGFAGVAAMLFGGWFGILLYRFYSIIRWAAYEVRVIDDAET